MARILFIKNRKRATDMKKSFTSLILIKETIDMKKSIRDIPATTIDENNNISSILTPPFFFYPYFI